MRAQHLWASGDIPSTSGAASLADCLRLRTCVCEWSGGFCSTALYRLHRIFEYLPLRSNLNCLIWVCCAISAVAHSNSPESSVVHREIFEHVFPFQIYPYGTVGSLLPIWQMDYHQNFLEAPWPLHLLLFQTEAIRQSSSVDSTRWSVRLATDLRLFADCDFCWMLRQTHSDLF